MGGFVDALAAVEPANPTVVGNKRFSTITATLTGKYATGGFEMSAEQFGLIGIEHGEGSLDITKVYSALYQQWPAAGKASPTVWWSVIVVATGIEVAPGTDLTGIQFILNVIGW
jgi:hypothetical protein